MLFRSDYIHVQDLAQAHWLAVQYLCDGGESNVFNLGNSQGYSVQQVIDAARQVSNRPIKVIDGERREGDPAVLVADSSKIKQLLGWQPVFADLKTMVQHAWQAEAKYCC